MNIRTSASIIQIEKKKSIIVSRLSFTELMAYILKHYVDYLNYD